MRYKKETLARLIRTAKIVLEGMKAELNDKHACVSMGNKKIGRVMNVSTMPLLACGNCKECGPFCYDVKACVRFPKNVLENRVKNYALAHFQRDKFFAEIADKCRRRRKNKFFRWHVAGDILDADYLDRMVKMAREFPDFRFWTYTKMYTLINEYVASHGGTMAAAIPGNLVIMFSDWDGLAMENPYSFPIFAVKMKDGNLDHSPEFFDSLYKCPGNCDACKAAGRGCIAGENTYNDEH